jgi:hypothetical protein
MGRRLRQSEADTVIDLRRDGASWAEISGEVGRSVGFLIKHFGHLDPHVRIPASFRDNPSLAVVGANPPDEEDEDCEACGEPIKSHWKVCPGCGGKLVDVDDDESED